METWNRAIDGAVSLGKLGAKVGGVVGAGVGLFSNPALWLGMIGGPFGYAVLAGVVGAVGTAAAGAAVGFIAGGLYGAARDIMGMASGVFHKSKKREAAPQQERIQAPQRTADTAYDNSPAMSDAQETPATNYRDMVRASSQQRPSPNAGRGY